MNVKLTYRLVASPASPQLFNSLGLASKFIDRILDYQPDFESLRLFRNEAKGDVVVILSPCRYGSMSRKMLATVASQCDTVIQLKNGRWLGFNAEESSKNEITCVVLNKIDKMIFGETGSFITINKEILFRSI